MVDGRTVMRRRGWLSRAVVFWAALVLVGCATTDESTEPRKAALRPVVQGQSPSSQIVGEAIVASLGGVAVTVRWLGEGAVGQYYAGRPGLEYPWPPKTWEENPPTIFFLRVQNRTAEEVQFDPAMTVLVAQDGKRDLPIPYEEMYLRLSGTDDAAPRIASLQATMLSRFIVLRPGGQREGLLLFPTIRPEAKHLLLEFPSFFVGGRATPSHFEFQVIRQR
jgi:hypothetical protein